MLMLRFYLTLVIYAQRIPLALGETGLNAYPIFKQIDAFLWDLTCDLDIRFYECEMRLRELD